MLLDNGSIVACGLKTVHYGHWYSQELAHCELEALQAARGLPNIVQCFGAFQLQDAEADESLLVIATE